MKKLLVTGSGGLIGSECVKFFAEKGFKIVGIDNNMREYFFGPEASTEWNRKTLEERYKSQYQHYNIDIRDKDDVEKIFGRKADKRRKLYNGTLKCELYMYFK